MAESRDSVEQYRMDTLTPEETLFVDVLGRNLEHLLTLDESRSQVTWRLFRIERRLLDNPLAPAPIGSTLTDVLRNIWLEMKDGAAPLQFARQYLAKVIHTWRGPQRRWENPYRVDDVQGRTLLGFLSPRKERQTFIPFLVDAIGAESCCVLSDFPSVKEELPAAACQFSWSTAPHVRNGRLRAACARPVSIWRRHLRALGAEIGLSGLAQLAILDGLISNCNRFHRYRKFLEYLRPAKVLVEYDRHGKASCLILAARSLGIPTFTMVHGVIAGPFGYTPVLADRILCWGELQYRKLVRFGTEAGRIDIVGYVEPIGEADGQQARELRAKLKVADGEIVAVLATAPYGQARAEYLTEVFCDVILSLERVRGVVRLHPSEKMTSYSSLVNRFPQVTFVTSQEQSLDEILSVADVVVVHSSGFGSEALAKGTPCVVLDVLDLPLGHGEDLVTIGGMPRAQNGVELRTILERLAFDQDYSKRLVTRASRFSRIVFAARGQEACSNIARVLKGKRCYTIQEAMTRPDVSGCLRKEIEQGGTPPMPGLPR